jgi:hypothetical protein
VELEVWAEAIPMPPASRAAAAINAVLVVSMRRILQLPRGARAGLRTTRQRGSRGTVPDEDRNPAAGTFSGATARADRRGGRRGGSHPR